MASGGARGNSGRTADPDALRRDRTGDGVTFITLPADGYDGPLPAWPLTPNPEPAMESRETIVWERLWRTPQAAQWVLLNLSDEIALYTRYLVEAEQPGARANIRTLVKQHQELLGLSTAGLARLKWKIGTAAARTETKAPAAKRSASRGRLRAVPNVGGTI